MPGFFVPMIVIHVLAVLAKLAIFFVIPRLQNVEDVRNFLTRYRSYERTADWILWLSGAGLIYFAGWRMLIQPWMLIGIGLYLIVFLLVKFSLMRELDKISHSKKLVAGTELSRLRTNNWCVALVSIGLLAVIAYLMMVKPG